MGLIEDIGTYLAAQSGTFVLGTNTFLNFLPDIPNRAYVVFESPGSVPDYTLGASTKVAIEKPRFQVLTRSTSSTQARADMDLAWTILGGVKNQVLSGTTYLRVAAMHSPFLYERDKRGRPVYSVTFDVMKRR